MTRELNAGAERGIRRIVVAFLVSPWPIPPVLTAVLSVGRLWGLPRFQVGSWPEHLRRVFSESFSIYILGYAYGATLIAVPIIAWLTTRNRATAAPVIALGGALGAVPFVIYVVMVYVDEGGLGVSADTLLVLLAGVSAGASAAAAFWLIAGKSLLAIQETDRGRH
jgi:hypothetical protein